MIQIELLVGSQSTHPTVQTLRHYVPMRVVPRMQVKHMLILPESHVLQFPSHLRQSFEDRMRLSVHLVQIVGDVHFSQPASQDLQILESRKYLG